MRAPHLTLLSVLPALSVIARIAPIAALATILACKRASDPGPPPAEPPSEGPYRERALDALAPLLVASELAPLRDTIRALRAAHDSDLERLPLRSRVVLQNDVWGLAQRVAASSSTAPEAQEVQGVQEVQEVQEAQAAAAALVWKLALPAESLRRIEGLSIPPHVRAAIGEESEGFRERSSEHRVLGHERAFGLRRAFRILLAEGQHALISQLVALDRDGRAHLTDIVGDVELLQFDGPRLLAARVLHLERRVLRTSLLAGSLVEVERIAQIPSEGASRPIIRFDPPARVADLPCAQCHEDDSMMSLPFDGETPLERLRIVLSRAEAARPPRSETTPPPPRREATSPPPAP
ncbi:MAG: hypothetical protein IT384_09065 [Deltaproteobacteria bacterium]|nr:hypothetical protein [Deltaproteobacteria bacterium]